MEVQEDTIVDIAPNREKFFGRSGRMLKPCPATVAALIKKVPKGQLITLDRLREVLADQYRVEVTCPFVTKQALRAIARAARPPAAYWRVVRKNGELIAYFPGGLEGHAARLRAEGLAIDTAGKTPKVKNFKESLVQFP